MPIDYSMILSISTTDARYKTINEAILVAQQCEPIFLNEYCPSDHRRRFEFIQELSVKVECQRYSFPGGPVHIYWIWRIYPEDKRSEGLQKHTKVTADLQIHIPVYHSRSMKRQFVALYGRCTGTKPVILRYIFRRLTGDQSVSQNLTAAEVDARVAEMMETEDSDLIGT